MEIRFNTTNEKVEKALEQIRKTDRKYFVEEAIVHYLRYLEVDKLATSVFLDIDKIDQVKGEEEKDEQLEERESEIEGDTEDSNISDNDEFAGGW